DLDRPAPTEHEQVTLSAPNRRLHGVSLHPTPPSADFTQRPGSVSRPWRSTSSGGSAAATLLGVVSEGTSETPSHDSMMADHAVQRRPGLMPGMALDAPAHRQGRDLRDPLHPLDRPVALLARQAGRDVPLVGEVDVARHLVDADPRDRL